jgi:Na+-transporting methylmalonyl-CoA/oxaloacetate decarboxylase gamma subunit
MTVILAVLFIIACVVFAVGGLASAERQIRIRRRLDPEDDRYDL